MASNAQTAKGSGTTVQPAAPSGGTNGGSESGETVITDSSGDILLPEVL